MARLPSGYCRFNKTKSFFGLSEFEIRQFSYRPYRNKSLLVETRREFKARLSRADVAQDKLFLKLSHMRLMNRALSRT